MWIVIVGSSSSERLTDVGTNEVVSTVDLEIFVVKIFSWFAQTTKIKNTKYILQRIIIIALTILVAQFRSTAS